MTQKIELEAGISAHTIGYAEINGPHVSIYLHPSSYITGETYEQFSENDLEHDERYEGLAFVKKNASKAGLYLHQEITIGLNDSFEDGYIASWDPTRVEKIPGNWDHLLNDILAAKDDILDQDAAEAIVEGTGWAPIVADQ